MGDAHVYANHVDPLKEQLQNSLRPFPVSGFAVISNLRNMCDRSAFVLSSCLSVCCYQNETKCIRVQVLHIKTEKTDIDAYTMGDLEISGYNPHKKIAMKMAV
jgi:thymidylate synthase